MTCMQECFLYFNSNSLSMRFHYRNLVMERRVPMRLLGLIHKRIQHLPCAQFFPNLVHHAQKIMGLALNCAPQHLNTNRISKGTVVRSIHQLNHSIIIVGFKELFSLRTVAEEGNRVWALTLLGFGRSEKPDVAYTELLWAELIRDFIVEVVGEPAIVVGNSIGGYIVSMVAGLWPEIVKSLILLNTAGGIVPDYLSHTYIKPSRRTGITWAGSQLSLSYLRSAAPQLLRKYYSVNPSRVDEWLLGEILRASYDPGAAIVLESFYCLKNPYPINWFLDRYKGSVFVIQGTKDPLSNSTERKKLFESYYNNAVVQLVDAGHCPHDEIPDKVNKLIVDWLERTNLRQADSALSQAVQCV